MILGVNGLPAGATDNLQSALAGRGRIEHLDHQHNRWGYAGKLPTDRDWNQWFTRS